MNRPSFRGRDLPGLALIALGAAILVCGMLGVKPMRTLWPTGISSYWLASLSLALAGMTWLSVTQQRRKEIEAERLTRALERNVLHLRLLHAVTSDPQLSFTEKAISLLDQIRTTLGADCATLMVLEGGRLASELVSCPPGKDISHLFWKADTPACQQALVRDGPVVYVDEPINLPVALGQDSVSAFLGERIMVDNEPYGLLALVNLEPRMGPYSPDDLDQMRLVTKWLEFELNSDNAARALRDSEKQFKSLASTMPGMVFQFVRDSGGTLKFTYVSEGSKAVFGLEPAQIVADGLLITRMADPRDGAGTISARLDEVQRSQSLYHRIGRFNLRGGEVRWIESYIMPQMLEDGVVSWTGISIDVTTQKQLEDELDEARDRITAVLSSVDDVIFSTTPDLSQTTFVSDASIRILGHPPSEYLKDDELFLRNVHPDDRNELEAGFSAISEDRSMDAEVRYLHPDGRILWLRVRAHLSVGEDGQPLRVDGITTDVTSRKQSEMELDQARDEAVKANAAKSEFLSRMSHELRTPMNAILGFAQLLELDNLTKKQSESVQHILRAGRHLLELVDEVLDISRIESGTLAISLEPVELSRLVSESVALVRPLAIARTITFRREAAIPPEMHVLADRQRLRQVLLNLLSNSIKYSPIGATVTVRETRREGKAVIEVEDQGAGLNSSQIERLFIPFDRLGAETTGIEGTGLGLPLAKRLLESMGGGLGIRSVPEEGSIFWAELLIAESQSSALEAAQLTQLGPINYGESIREVLLIEDNLSNVRLIEEIVRTMPQTSLISAMQGRLGFDLAREHPPAVILLDMNLPDVHGLELLSQIRAEKSLARVPVIVLSADATDRLMERALAEGANAYLTKPFNVRQLIGTLNEHLGRRPRDD